MYLFGIWYIRLKVQPPANTEVELSSTEFESILQDLRDILTQRQKECQIWPNPMVDISKAYFWLLGVSNLPPTELSKCRQLLREWQKVASTKMKGNFSIFEAKFIPRKLLLEHGFEMYTPPNAAAPETMEDEPVPPTKNQKETKEALPAAGYFKKIKGSNPQEVRRQFLEHSMKPPDSSHPNTDTDSTGKLRLGKEVLNRMKFDARYNDEDFVVGYIDRKEGILEKSFEEWGHFGQEELMAYIKNFKEDEIVWDKARKVDLVFGKKGG